MAFFVAFILSLYSFSFVSYILFFSHYFFFSFLFSLKFYNSLCKETTGTEPWMSLLTDLLNVMCKVH